MRYDFDKVTDRRTSNSIKWAVLEQELPMWVADMDFETAPEIKEAILKRAEHGIFGYPGIPDEWYNAYINGGRNAIIFSLRKNGSCSLQE